MSSVLSQALAGDQRPPDGYLHPSGDLLSPLRHVQLRAAGAPTIREDLVSLIRLRTGTMWHQYLGATFVRAGFPFMQEIDVTPGLPEGWSGTADWLFWDPEVQGFVLGDLKTTRGEGIYWIKQKGPKLEHVWQLSAYWYALVEMGFPMTNQFGIMYLPMNATQKPVEPLLAYSRPIDRTTLYATLEGRTEAVSNYLTAYRISDHLLNNYLAPEPEREQKLKWNTKSQVHEVQLVPHWQTMFCPFDESLCTCRNQGITKIGQFTQAGEYVPRKGYEGIEVTVTPKGN